MPISLCIILPAKSRSDVIFVYKVMGLTFHDRINTQLIYRIEIAQVVARRIIKPHGTFFRFESHWLLFFIHLFIFFSFFLGGGGGMGGGLILLSSSCLFFFSFSFFFFFLFFCYFLLFFIILTCIRYIFKNFYNNTSYCKFGNTSTSECERQNTYLRRQNL